MTTLRLSGKVGRCSRCGDEVALTEEVRTDGTPGMPEPYDPRTYLCADCNGGIAEFDRMADKEPEHVHVWTRGCPVPGCQEGGLL